MGPEYSAPPAVLYGPCSRARPASCWVWPISARSPGPSPRRWPAPGGGSVIAMTYYGAEKVAAGYNVMGVAKASLEASVRYLAADLGPKNIRVNAISAGPVNTLAARGIRGFTGMLKHHAEKAPLRRNVELREIGDAALFLLPPMAP